MVICDLLLGLAESSGDGQHFLAIKYFLIKACTFFFGHNTTAHFMNYSIV